MPLLRLQGERVFQRNVFDLVAPNMFAGSILDLEPDTAYEARFVLTDPDGVGGPAANATKTVTVRTRPEPMPADGRQGLSRLSGRSGRDRRSSRRSKGIMCAYNYYCGAGDTAPGGRPRVKPGDTILVHAGTYAYHYEFYGNQTTVNATTPFEGTYYLTAQGHAGEADRDQGGRRRRGDLRRPRQLQPVQRQGRRLQLLRRDHVPEHRASRSGRARSSSPARKG